MKGTDKMKNYKSTRDFQKKSNERAKRIFNSNPLLVKKYGLVKLATGDYTKYDGISYTNLLTSSGYIIEFKTRDFGYFDIYKGKKVVNKFVKEGVFIECGVIDGKVKHNEKYENLIALGEYLNKEPLYISILMDETVIVHNLSKISTSNLQCRLRWVADNFNQYEKHEKKYGSTFIKFDVNAYKNKSFKDEYTKIQNRLLKPMYQLTEDQGETYINA